MKLFELHRFYSGKEISGFEFCGITFDFRTWYLSKATKTDFKKYSLFIKDGYWDSWSHAGEIGKDLQKHPERYKKIPWHKHIKFHHQLYNRFVFGALIIGFIIGVSIK